MQKQLDKVAHYFQRHNNSNDSVVSFRDHREQEEVAQHFSSVKRKELSTSNYVSGKKYPLNNDGEIKIFSDEGKLRDTVANHPVVK